MADIVVIFKTLPTRESVVALSQRIISDFRENYPTGIQIADGNGPSDDRPNSILTLYITHYFLFCLFLHVFRRLDGPRQYRFRRHFVSRHCAYTYFHYIDKLKETDVRITFGRERDETAYGRNTPQVSFPLLLLTLTNGIYF